MRRRTSTLRSASPVASSAGIGINARGAIVAQGAGKLAIDQGLEGSLADGLNIETSHFVGLFTTEDAKIGVDSFLANGPGKAKFVGR